MHAVRHAYSCPRSYKNKCIINKNKNIIIIIAIFAGIHSVVPGQMPFNFHVVKNNNPSFIVCVSNVGQNLYCPPVTERFSEKSYGEIY